MKGGIQLVSKIDHIGIAVSNLDETVKLYRDVLGLSLIHISEPTRPY